MAFYLACVKIILSKQCKKVFKKKLKKIANPNTFFNIFDPKNKNTTNSKGNL
jgi:hypothetical protein